MNRNPNAVLFMLTVESLVRAGMKEPLAKRQAWREIDSLPYVRPHGKKRHVKARKVYP